MFESWTAYQLNRQNPVAFSQHQSPNFGVLTGFEYAVEYLPSGFLKTRQAEEKR